LDDDDDDDVDDDDDDGGGDGGGGGDVCRATDGPVHLTRSVGLCQNLLTSSSVRD